MTGSACCKWAVSIFCSASLAFGINALVTPLLDAGKTRLCCLNNPHVVVDALEMLGLHVVAAALRNCPSRATAAPFRNDADIMYSVCIMDRRFFVAILLSKISIKVQLVCTRQ